MLRCIADTGRTRQTYTRSKFLSAILPSPSIMLSGLSELLLKRKRGEAEIDSVTETASRRPVYHKPDDPNPLPQRDSSLEQEDSGPQRTELSELARNDQPASRASEKHLPPRPENEIVERSLTNWTSGKSAIFPEGKTLGLTAIHTPTDLSNTLVDIIFIHGLTGDAYDTWFKKDTKDTKERKDNKGKKAQKEKDKKDNEDAKREEEDCGVYWPTHLLPQDIADARILAFGYDADVTKVFGAVGQGKLRDHADALLGDLATLRDADDTVGSQQLTLNYIVLMKPTARPEDHIHHS